MPGEWRTFRRNISKFWDYWPLPSPSTELYHYIHVDGIYLSRDLVILIAASDDHVLSWYMARSETSQSWQALLDNIAAPDAMITDGGSGFQKALKNIWPDTKIQRCLFHGFCQVRRYTTSRPKLLASQELYSIARNLLHIETLSQAQLWVEHYLNWYGFLK